MNLDGFNQWLAERNLQGYWTLDRGRTGPGPEARFRPYLWKWSDMEQALQYAGELVPPEESFRRFVGYMHPEAAGATHTVLLGAQMVKPGERPEAHRHTMAAIRFVIAGSGARTIVNGEEFPMEPGDLITTPSRTWHDHDNPSAEPIIWLDGADGPLIRLLQVGSGDLFPKPNQDVTRQRGLSSAEWSLVRPSWSQAAGPQPPPHRYPWQETQQVLSLLAEEAGDPFDGVLLRYVNPVSGGPTLPTLSCEIQMLRPGEKTRAHRHTSSVVYHAFRGRGRTVIDGEAFAWEQGDTFVVPLWCVHHHESHPGGAAYLFSISDRPVMEQLGLYREEAS